MERAQKSDVSELDALIAQEPERRGLPKHYPLKRIHRERLEEHAAKMRASARVQGRRKVA